MEQYVKGFQRFHAGEDVRPATSCKFFTLLLLLLLLLFSLLLSLLLLSMMTLITGFTCPPTIYFKFITKCDSFFYYKVLQSAMVCYYKVPQLFYYKVRQVLLRSATGITKCDNFITKCDRYYKVRRLLQSATVHTLKV